MATYGGCLVHIASLNSAGGLLLAFSILPVKLFFETICGRNPQEGLMTLLQRKGINYK